MADAEKKQQSIIGMCEIHQILSGLDEISQTIDSVKKSIEPEKTVDAEVDLARLFAVTRTNTNDLEKTISRMRNELIDMGVALDRKLNNKPEKERSDNGS